MALTSSPVNPNVPSNLMLRTLFTVMLFNPENMPSLAICMTPVMTPNMRDSLPFRTEAMMSLMNWTTSPWNSFPYALSIGLSYSSNNMMTRLPWCS